MTTTLVIEHCEPGLSDWLALEYKHASTVWKDHTIFTNVKSQVTAAKLRQLGTVTHIPCNEYLKDQHCLILDPKASRALTASDFKGLDSIIIGGILGFKNPRGRTKTLISDHSHFKTRHIGPIQLTIDGAAVVAKAINLGMKLEDIEIAYEVEIQHNTVHSTVLPFGYPVFDGNPVITPGLLEYLTKK